MAFLLAVGITIAVIAWGYLVYLSIVHGQAIRAGDQDVWPLALASGFGAVACLFVGFMLVARLLRLLGNASPAPESAETSTATHAAGRRIRVEDSS